ncbi:hypothetical protein BG261_06805 [Floricoccus tropicus]|uniref:Uncharacterized protein n=1 Tax=Floricoccus tropicus TaxID=1859473 RepID=A0A1E8GK25_9LACT|nr:hypothetical protein [Floricoccus tropicus]OFI48600.1 hypothetical protein BG261_06805 [Floricoccus tropicus]
MTKEKKLYSRRFKKNHKISLAEEDSDVEEVQKENVLNLDETSKKEKKVLIFVLLAQISILLSLSFRSFPLFNVFYTGLKESINTYSGFAMNNGQVPYNNFYSNDGPIFFLINELGNILGNTWILWGFEVLNLLLISSFIYKLARKRNLSVSYAILISILSIIGITVTLNGGNLASGFAIYPMLWSIEFIEKIFNSEVDSDRNFILFGLFQAITIFIVPGVLLVNILFFVFFFIKFFKDKPFDKQKTYKFIYNLLSYIFGFLIIFYLIIYYGLINQFLSTAVEQMFILPFQSIVFDSSLILNVVVTLVVLILIFGKQLISILKELRGVNKDNIFYKYIICSLLVYFIFTILNPMYVIGDMVILLPLLIVPILRNENMVDKKFSFLTVMKHLSLPIIGIFAVLALCINSKIENKSIFEDEKRVASYLKQETSKKDRAIVLSDDYNIYVNSKRLAMLPIPLPSYPEKYKLRFEELLPKTESKFIILEDDYNGVGTKTVKNEIASFYSLNKKFKSNNFEVYNRIKSDESLLDDKESDKEKKSSKEKTKSLSNSSEKLDSNSSEELQPVPDFIPDQQYNNFDPNRQYYGQ